MSNKLHVVVNQVGGFAREDASQPYAVGVYSHPDLAAQVKRLSMEGAQVNEVELDAVPPGLVQAAKAMGVKLPLPPSWQDVNRQLSERYRDLARQNYEDLEAKLGHDLARRTLSMCDHLLKHVDEMSEDKANRWLGFVQGMLTVAKCISVEYPAHRFNQESIPD